MCKTSVMDCCQHLIVINSKRSRVHGAISDTSGKDGVWVALWAIKGDWNKNLHFLSGTASSKEPFGGRLEEEEGKVKGE